MLVNLYTSYHIPKNCIDNEIQNTDKPNKRFSVINVRRHDFQNGVMAYMLQFG